MNPADQGLGRVHGRGSQGHLGLIVQAQLTMLDRMAQLAQQRQVFLLAGIELRFVDRVADLAALGDIHRDIGVSHQGLGVRCMFGIQRDTDTGADIERLVLEKDRSLQCGEDVLCQFDHLRGLQRRHQKCEFIAPQPCDAPGRAEQLVQAHSDLA